MKNQRSIMKKFSLVIRTEWETKKKELGVLLVKHPALLHALLKETRASKEAYFRFLSDRYQSLEGLSVLAF